LQEAGRGLLLREGGRGGEQQGEERDWALHGVSVPRKAMPGQVFAASGWTKV
jgi:hypothetical protein